MTFPLALAAGRLTPADLVRFSRLFNKTIDDFFPFDSSELLPIVSEESIRALPHELAEKVAAVVKTGQPLADQEGLELLLPVWAAEDLIGILIGRGGDEKLYGMSLVWLDEQSHIISREFHLLKQSCLDPATGLFNGYHLQSELQLLLAAASRQAKGAAEPSALALLEVYPRSRDADRSLQYIVRAGSYLDTLLGESLLLHHMGAGIFGLLWQGVEMDQARQLGDGLLRRLKREDFSSAHLGLTMAVPHDPDYGSGVEQLFDQAWQALRIARKRGPFSLCGHATAADRASHPLRKTPESVLKKLRKLWRGRERFALVLLRMDQEPVSNHFSKRVRSAVGQDAPLILVSQREAFLFLDDRDGKQAQAWLKKFRKKMDAIGGSTFSMGVATYPYHTFRKSDMPMNCRKAVLHSGFLGPDSLAVFDAVSLNISGDVYFNEGDLAWAMKEYRKGLALDPANLNLLNSLGVTSVQLKRPKLARSYFEEVLARNPENFMALFNLGFVALNCNREDEALAYLEKALAVDDHHLDLLQHLGALYCQRGDFRQAVRLLARCEKLSRKASSRSGELTFAVRWLGRAYEAEGELAKAMACYQRAVSGNPRDAGSLSRLGRLYFIEKQGNDIALSLCRQAVELNPRKAAHWFRLGWLQAALQDSLGAIESLMECQRLDSRHLEADLLLAQTFEQEGEFTQARRIYKKILRYRPDHAEAQAAVAVLS